jgi:hypothetical protein
MANMSLIGSGSSLLEVLSQYLPGGSRGNMKVRIAAGLAEIRTKEILTTACSTVQIKSSKLSDVQDVSVIFSYRFGVTMNEILH